jgi:hypothetical protein
VQIEKKRYSCVISFITFGADPDGEFLKYVDESESGQKILDLSFKIHMERLLSMLPQARNKYLSLSASLFGEPGK